MSRHWFLSSVLSLAVAVSTLAVADPAAAAVPSLCEVAGYPNGRKVTTSNANNGNGAVLEATLCWQRLSNTYPYRYHTQTWFTIRDNAANGAGATARLEWIGADNKKHYWVPPTGDRAWQYGDTASGWRVVDNIRGLYVRACLTNTNRPAHHCGPLA